MTLHDDARPCDVCRFMSRDYVTLAVLKDGALVQSMTLCRVHASQLQDRIDAELRPKVRA